MRTITLNIDMGKLEDAPDLNIQAAIGRLAVWALDGYAQVTISNDGRNDLIATYVDYTRARKFTIGAVWRFDSQEYTFHS
jgi:hypothetical protein